MADCLICERPGGDVEVQAGLFCGGDLGDLWFEDEEFGDGESKKFAHASCVRELFHYARRRGVCAHCGAPADQYRLSERCPRCGEDLAAAPDDNTECPYCDDDLKPHRLIYSFSRGSTSVYVCSTCTEDILDEDDNLAERRLGMGIYEQ